MKQRNWYTAFLLSTLISSVFFATTCCTQGKQKVLHESSLFNDNMVLKPIRVLGSSTPGGQVTSIQDEEKSPSDDQQKIRALIKQLNHRDFKKRHEASAQLVKRGASTLGLLRDFIVNPKTETEIRARAIQVLQKIYTQNPQELAAQKTITQILESPTLSDRVKGHLAETIGMLWGYEVHEWGVMSVMKGQKWANAQMAHEWSTLPKGMYRAIPKWKLPSAYQGPVDKPVIYFYFDKIHNKTAIKKPFLCSIKFTKGHYALWFPTTRNLCEMNHGRRPVKKIEDTMTWEFYGEKAYLSARRQQAGNAFQRMLPSIKQTTKLKVDPSHWYADLRQTKSSTLYALGPVSFGKLGATRRVDQEKFIYYDGLMQPLDYLSTQRLKNNNLLLINNAPYTIYDLFAIEINNGQLSLCVVDEIRKGQQKTELKMQRITKENWQNKTSQNLVERLVRAGLFKDEATMLEKIWRPGFFQQQGVTLLYRLPQAEYDRATKISLHPKPSRLVRVGLIRQSHAEPELGVVIKKMIDDLLADDPATSNKASRKLIKYGVVCLDDLHVASQNQTDVSRRRKLEKHIKMIRDSLAQMPNKK